MKPNVKLRNENEFKGKIGRTIKESEPWWPELVKPEKGTPNVLFIVLDDLGFGQLGCYGSEIHTPHIDYLSAYRP